MVASHVESNSVNSPAVQIEEADKCVRISCLGSSNHELLVV
jgi:hypothetical protein